MSPREQVIKSICSSPILLLGYTLSFAYQLLQLKYSSDLVIQTSSLIMSIVIVSASVTQVGIPAKVYYNYLNNAGSSGKSDADQITRYCTSLVAITAFLSILALPCFIATFSKMTMESPMAILTLSIIFFAALPFNQMCVGIYYAQGRANMVSVFLLLEPLFRFLLLLIFLLLTGTLSVAAIISIYSISSVLQLGVALYVDAEFRSLIATSIKMLPLRSLSSHLEVVSDCWLFGLQQLTANFSEQMPTVVTAAIMPPGATAYFIVLTKISSLLSVIPTHLVKLSLISKPIVFLGAIIKPTFYTSSVRRMASIVATTAVIAIVSRLTLSYLLPIDISRVPLTIIAFMIAVAVILRLWFMLVDSYFGRILNPTRSVYGKSYAVVISIFIFASLRFSLHTVMTVDHAFYLVSFFFMLLSASPIFLTLYRSSSPPT